MAQPSFIGEGAKCWLREEQLGALVGAVWFALATHLRAGRSWKHN